MSPVVAGEVKAKVSETARGPAKIAAREIVTRDFLVRKGGVVFGGKSWDWLTVLRHPARLDSRMYRGHRLVRGSGAVLGAIVIILFIVMCEVVSSAHVG